MYVLDHSTLLLPTLTSSASNLNFKPLLSKGYATKEAILEMKSQLNIEIVVSWAIQAPYLSKSFNLFKNSSESLFC